MATPNSKSVVPRQSTPPDAKRRLARLEREQFEDALFHQIERAGLRVPERQVRLVPGRESRFDFAWPGQLLACEVDGGLHSGGRHVRGAGAERDAEKYSLAAVEGYRVLRVSTTTVADGRALEYARRALSWRDGASGAPLRTRTGRVLNEADNEALAEEAERGDDVRRLVGKPSPRPRKS